MANKFLIKRGDGAPNAGTIDEYELVYDYTNVNKIIHEILCSKGSCPVL